MKKLLLAITLLLPILSQSNAFAQSSAAEQEHNREIDVAKLLENDFALVVGRYEGNATAGSEQYKLNVDLRMSRIIVAGMSVPQPILTGVLNITPASNENYTLAYPFNAGIYDSTSHMLTFHVPGMDASSGVDVQCIRNTDESLSCDWLSTDISNEIKFTLIKNKPTN